MMQQAAIDRSELNATVALQLAMERGAWVSVVVRPPPPERRGRVIEGVPVEETPLRVVVEELAHAILADKRARKEAPPALAHFAHLFGLNLDDGDRSE